MKVSIAEFTDSINTMNPILERKQTVLEQLEKAVNGFIEDKILQGKSYESARGYFREIHLPALRGMILLYEEIRSANTRCLSDLYSQVTSDYSMKMDTGGMEYFIYEAKRTLNELATLEQESPFIQQQRANLQRIETEIHKVMDFHCSHAGHYDMAMMYMDDVRIALAQFQHKSYNSKSKIYTYEVKNKIGSVHINKKWKLYEYKKKIKSYIKEDGQVDYKNLNHKFWNREDGYFEGNWWQDPEKLAEATYVLKQEAGAYDGINIVDMISQYQEGEPNPRLNTLQALANDQRVSYYDISVIDSIMVNLNAMGLKYDESKGTISVEDIEALTEREKDIIFRRVGNWLENGGLILIEGVAIIVVGGYLSKAGSSASKLNVSKTSSSISGKYKVGQSPKIKSSSYSKVSIKSKADILSENRAKGRAYEQQEFAKFSSSTSDAVEQITIKTNQSTKIRVDAIGTDGNGKVIINEYKSSIKAPLTANQKVGFPELQQGGGVVVGKGKGIFTGGYQITKGTEVKIIRPSK